MLRSALTSTIVLGLMAAAASAQNKISCNEAHKSYLDKLSSGAYASMLKRVDPLQDAPISDALARREKTAEKLLAMDDLVSKVVEALKARGMKSPYLKPFVVARVNPIRWVKEVKITVEQCLDECIDKLGRFEVEKVKEQDLAKMGGAPPEPEEG